MVWAHLRHAFRAFGREPGFALFAVLTLALGIGASTAMFSVFNGVLLSPVPFADPARVVSLNTKFTAEGRQISRVTGGDWMDLAAAATPSTRWPATPAARSAFNSAIAPNGPERTSSRRTSSAFRRCPHRGPAVDWGRCREVRRCLRCVSRAARSDRSSARKVSPPDRHATV